MRTYKIDRCRIASRIRKAGLQGVVIALPLVLTAGCVSDPVIDRKGADLVHYEEHLRECEGYTGDVQQGKIIGSRIAGYAVAGALIGAIFGDHRAASDFAASGVVQGGVDGIMVSEADKAKVVASCLERRGYAVLNKPS